LVAEVASELDESDGSGEAAAVATDGLVASVGGPVIDEDEFPMVAGDAGEFFREAEEEFWEHGLLVEEGNDQRDDGRR